MLRFKQQTRRDHVVSLLPPISVIKNKEPSVQERIYSDNPPPVTYTGSFPAKVLRHLDKSTFYSTPTKGETFLATKTMHDEERTADEKNDPKKTSSEDKGDGRTDQNKKNKTVKSKIKKKGKERKEDGMGEEERRCSSAPGFREDELKEQLPETGNLTAPVTPRFTNSRKSTEKTSRVCTPARSPTPREFASPDLRIAEQQPEVMLELRGDRIEMGSHVKDFRVDSTPNSRGGTPCRLRAPEQDTYQARPKIRSAIREVPCAQKRSEKASRVPPKFEIRAVGFSMPFHEKSEVNSISRTKERKNDTKVIKIPRAEGEEPSVLTLPTVTEAEDICRDEENNPNCEGESPLKENNSTQENEEIEGKENTKDESNESTGDKQTEQDENVKSSGKQEVPGNENGKENGSGHGNDTNKHQTENETDIMINQKKKKSAMDKKGGHRNSKTKGHKK